MKVMIIGAKPGSLGEAIGLTLDRVADSAAIISGGLTHEDYRFDVRDALECAAVIKRVKPASIIYTAGVNLTEGSHLEDEMVASLDVNLIGAVRLFEAWCEHDDGDYSGIKSFVTISSNSAHIARSASPAYCASKAALSMWTRAVGRAEANLVHGAFLWGYEPGFIAHTPMSKSVQARLPISVPTHRIPAGGSGLSAIALAQRICSDWLRVHEPIGGAPDISLRGTMVRCDGGDQ